MNQYQGPPNPHTHPFGAEGQPPPAPPKKSRVVPIVLGLAGIGVLAVVFAAGQASAPSATVARAADSVESPTKAPPPAPEEPELTPVGRLSRELAGEESLRAAVDRLLPTGAFTDNPTDKSSSASLALMAWMSIPGHAHWSDVGVAKDETSFAKVRKDLPAERGKRICVTGRIVEVGVMRPTATSIMKTPVSIGLLDTYAGNLYHFHALGSSGDLVERSQARFCGVVTGHFDYANSGGGMGHAVDLVGMFDLPENKAR